MKNWFLIAAVLWPLTFSMQGIAEESNPVVVSVTGRAKIVNGVGEVPRGLFGVHAVPLTEALVAEWGIEMDRIITQGPSGRPARATARKDGVGMLVECLYDRYQPALRITRADWKEYLAGLGRKYAMEARSSGEPHYLEFWNEPYLNWATNPAVNYHEAFYDKGNTAPGAPMKLKTTGEVIPNLVWDRQVFMAARKGSLAPDYVFSGYIPRQGEPGETVKLRYGAGEIKLEEGSEVEIRPGQSRVLLRQWSGKDVTQKFYWSGEVNRQFYLEMYEAFGRALKEENPEVHLAAGWGFNFFNENWECWRVLIRPTIDALHSWMDALHEHHYGGDTRLVAASYEVAYAYTLARHGKRIQFWNTEAGGHLDPQQPGVAKPGNEGDPLTRARAAMTYFLRDVIHLIAFCPDKAFSRAAHQAHLNGGDEFAFKLLKPLRGRLLETTSSSGRVWGAASTEDNRLAVVVFNDGHEPVPLELDLKAPGTSRITRLVRHEIGSVAEEAVPDGPGSRLQAMEIEIPVAAGGGGQKVQARLGGKHAAVWVATLDQPATPLETARWEQFVAGEVLQNASQSQPVRLSLDLPEGRHKAARAARLRLVLSSHPEGTIVAWNGTPLDLRDRTPWIADHVIDTALLQPHNQLTITPPDGVSVMVAAASLFLETP